jgi:hypothetical protein
MLDPLKRLESEVMVCSGCIRSMVVRFRLVFSRGVVGSSPLFWAAGMRVCSCTMGAMCVSGVLSLAVRFVMLATEPSEGSEREELAGVKVEGVKLLVWALGPEAAMSCEAVGRMGGTLGEKRETCGGVLLGVPPSAGSTALKDHVSPWVWIWS